MTIILTILKIIGEVILWIIAALIILVLVILVCPIFYEAKGEKYSKTIIQGKVKLFFGALSIRFKYTGNEETDAGLYIFGRKLGNNKKEKPDKSSRTNEVPDDKKIVAAEMNTGPDLKKTIITSEMEQTEAAKESKYVPNKEDDVWLNKGTENKSEPTVRKVKLYEIENSLREKKDTSQIPVKRIKLSDELKEKNNADDKEDAETDRGEKADSSKQKENKSDDGRDKLNAAYFLKMPKEERKVLFKAVVRLIKSLLKGVKPNCFYLKGTVGLDDPALTGEIVGAAWALNGILNKKIEISASFDKEVIEGEAFIKGNVVPMYMLFCLIRFALVKPVRKIIKILLKGSGDKRGKRNRKQSRSVV